MAAIVPMVSRDVEASLLLRLEELCSLLAVLMLSVVMCLVLTVEDAWQCVPCAFAPKKEIFEFAALQFWKVSKCYISLSCSFTSLLWVFIER